VDFQDVVMQRYATKQFTGQPVPAAAMDELLELIRYAPSALNLQPWKIRVVTDAALKEQLLPASWGQPQITSCSHLLVLCANTDLGGCIERLDRALTDAGVPQEMRTMVLGIARNMAASMTPDETLGWARAQTYLALGNAVNGAKAVGLDSCPMTGFDPAAYSRVLGLPSHIVPVAVCPVGYAADQPMPKMRFPMEELLV
jgi:nitroreductase / dihydropteridine reductase